MMEIVLNQSFEMDALVSKSGKFNVMNFQKALMDMIAAFKDYARSNGECLITTTKALEMVNGEQIMDVEMLIPINYRIPMDAPYQYKEKLKITNALYTKVTDVAQLQNTLNEINQYIADNNMQPITSAYLVQSKQENQPCVEVYIGLNPNIL